MSNKKEKIALVLSGGGSRGAYEAGVWQALTELGIDIVFCIKINNNLYSTEVKNTSSPFLNTLASKVCILKLPNLSTFLLSL